MILIAGGDGFIGKHVATALDNLDPNLYEIADLKRGLDVCAVNGNKYDVIILLAANLGQDLAMFQDNMAICKWAMRQKTAHIIYTSSAAVYGDTGKPHVEDEPTAAPTLYGRSKLLGERLIMQASEHYTILRLSNVYGDGEGNGAIDIFKRGGNRIYGSGEDVRDYVSVKTVADAIKTIALNPDRYNKQVFNISSKQPMTTLQAFEQYGTGQPIHEQARGFDVKHSVLDNSKAVAAGLINEN